MFIIVVLFFFALWMCISSTVVYFLLTFIHKKMRAKFLADKNTRIGIAAIFSLPLSIWLLTKQ